MLLIHLLLLISAASALEVTLRDGNEEENVEIDCDKNTKVNIVREKLISNGFITATSETHDWRILKDNIPIEMNFESWIIADTIINSGDFRLIFSNIKNNKNQLNIKIGKQEIQPVTINLNEKLSKVREHLSKNGSLGSQFDNNYCVKWKFLIRDREYVTDESQLTIAQHFENSKNDQLQITDVYSQDSNIQLYVYAGLKSILLPNISLDMNLYDFQSMLSGAGTCNGIKYDFLAGDDWLALKKTANLSSLKLSNPNQQISPDLIITPGEAKFSTIKNAYFKSRNGRYGIEYVMKTSKKRNIIGEVVEQYSRSSKYSTKVSFKVEKNTYCFGNCNEGVILDPVMLDNVQSTSTAVEFTSRVVIVQSGTWLQFRIDTEPSTDFWFTVKHDTNNEVFVFGPGVTGDDLRHFRYTFTVAESLAITKEENLLNEQYMSTFVVEIYERWKPYSRSRRNTGDQITLPQGSTNPGKLSPQGTYMGRYFGSGPGKFLVEMRFMLLTFKDVETAQEIMGRGVSRPKLDLL